MDRNLFVKVSFPGSYYEYDYICEDYSVEVGDWVMVPTPKGEKLALVKSFFFEDMSCMPMSAYMYKKVSSVIKATEEGTASSEAANLYDEFYHFREAKREYEEELELEEESEDFFEAVAFEEPEVKRPSKLLDPYAERFLSSTPSHLAGGSSSSSNRNKVLTDALLKAQEQQTTAKSIKCPEARTMPELPKIAEEAEEYRG